MCEAEGERTKEGEDYESWVDGDRTVERVWTGWSVFGLFWHPRDSSVTDRFDMQAVSICVSFHMRPRILGRVFIGHIGIQPHLLQDRGKEEKRVGMRETPRQERGEGKERKKREGIKGWRGEHVMEEAWSLARPCGSLWCDHTSCQEHGSRPLDTRLW